MVRYRFLIGAITLVFASVSLAEITVHEPNFAVDKLLDQIDGQIPRLEAISNPDYGFGVVAATVDNGILTILKLSAASIDVLATETGFPQDASVLDVRFDRTGLFSKKLFVSVVSNQFNSHSEILEIYPDGEVISRLSLGDLTNMLGFLFDFATSEHGYLPGMYLLDYNNDHWFEQAIYHMDPNFETSELTQHSIPSGRRDIDQVGVELDPTGLYENYLTMPEWDDNDKLAGIYQLRPDLSWKVLKDPQSWSSVHYRDLSFSSRGAFGQVLYVTDRVSETVMTVDPNGVTATFASGFSTIESITVSEDGENMFISDENGVYRIRATTAEPGPQIVMREPWVESDDVHTGPSGVDDLRILWSEPVLFDNADVNIVNEDANNVPFSVSGSNSAFMIIAFGETLLYDRYTITISDTVTSAVTGAPIDGDNDGLAGGDAILVMEHRRRSDFDNDNDVDFYDFANFALNWLWQE